MKSSTAVSKADTNENPVVVSGNTIAIKVEGADTENAYSVFELSVPPGVGAGFHIDHDWDEWWHVIEGRFEFNLNGVYVEVGAGGHAYGPKGLPHSFRNVSASTGKLVMLTRPAGLEAFFRAIHEASEQGDPDKETFVNIMRLHHIEPA